MPWRVFGEGDANEKSKHEADLCPVVLQQKTITLESLPLYKVLRLMQQNLKSISKQAAENMDMESNDNDALFATLMLFSKALTLMKDIVEGCNGQQIEQNPSIVQGFVHMCNFLREDSLTPSLVRAHIELVRKFNDKVMRYGVTQSDFLDPVDNVFFRKLTTFNQMVIFALGQDRFFNFGIVRTFIDSILIYPIEWLEKQKWLRYVFYVVVVICVIVFGVKLWQQFFSHYNETITTWVRGKVWKYTIGRLWGGWKEG